MSRIGLNNVIEMPTPSHLPVSQTYHRFSGWLISCGSHKLSQGDLVKNFSHRKAFSGIILSVSPVKFSNVKVSAGIIRNILRFRLGYVMCSWLKLKSLTS